MIEKIGYGIYKNSLLSSQFFCALNIILKKKVFCKTNKCLSKEGGSNSTGQKKMLSCRACPTEPWPAHGAALRQDCPFACLGFTQLPCSVTRCRLCQEGMSWAEWLSSWERLALEKPTAGGHRSAMLLAAGWQLLLNGDLGGACPRPSHQHCVPQRASVTGVEMRHSSCWRCSLSGIMKGISRRDLSEEARGPSCQSLLPPQSHAVPVTMQEFPRTIPQDYLWTFFTPKLHVQVGYLEP